MAKTKIHDTVNLMPSIIRLFFFTYTAQIDKKPVSTNCTTAAAIVSTPPRSVWGSPPQASAEPSTIPKTPWGPRSQISSEPSVIPKTPSCPPPQTLLPATRSSSAFPTLNESLRSSSLTKVSASTKDPRSQSAHQGNRRRAICSAVPDTAVLTPVHRPDDGGSKGQAITVFTNHFRVNIDDAVINQYDIDIAMIDRDGKLRSTRKDDRWNVIKSIFNGSKKFPVVW